MTWTQTILNIKDASNATQPVIAYTDGTNFSFAHPLLDSTGAIIGSGNPLAVGSSPNVISASFTRPADTNVYAVGDLVANNTTNTSVAALHFSNIARGANINDVLSGAILDKTGTSTTNALFRAHVFGIDPCVTAPTNGDNGAFAPAKKAAYWGFIDFTMTVFAFGDGCRAQGQLVIGNEMIFQPTSGGADLYALLEARGAYTPISGEVFTMYIGAK